MSNTQQSSDSDRLALTSADLALELVISQRHLHTLNKAGKIPEPLRLGNSVRWARAEIEDWLAAGAPDRAQWEARKGLSL